MNSQTSPRSPARLPSEEDRGFFQDLPLEFQLGDLAPQPRQLQPLIGGERGRPIGSLPALGGDPVAQRLVVDPQLACDLPDAAPAVENQLRRSLPELLGVLAPSAHPGPPSLAVAKSGGVQPTGVTSVVGRLTRHVADFLEL